MMGVLSSEWLKIRSSWSTYCVLAVVVAFVGLTVLLAWYAAFTWDHLSPDRRAKFALAPLPQLTEWVAALCLAVRGALAITSEYRTGMIRTSLTVVPRRRALLAAKTGVVAAVALAIGQASVFATSLASRLIIDGRPIRGQPTGPFLDQVPLLLAMGLSVTMFALLGLGLGAIMRSAVAAITTLVVLWHILPIVAHNLPSPWDGRVSSVMPGALVGQLMGTGNDASIYGALLPPWGALAVMAAYALLPLGAAAVLIGHRDV